MRTVLGAAVHDEWMYDYGTELGQQNVGPVSRGMAQTALTIGHHLLVHNVVPYQWIVSWKKAL